MIRQKFKIKPAVFILVDVKWNQSGVKVDGPKWTVNEEKWTIYERTNKMFDLSFWFAKVNDSEIRKWTVICNGYFENITFTPKTFLRPFGRQSVKVHYNFTTFTGKMWLN